MRTLSIRTIAPMAVGAAAASAAMLLIMFPAPSQAQHDQQGDAHAGPGWSAHWAPVEDAHLYLCAFHVAKMNHSFQVEAHHYCSPAGDKLHQCMVFDSNTADAKLLGVEYIIPNDVYLSLPKSEKKYWHPHAFEILSGQLIAPDMPSMGDDAFPGFLTTWGKTWHTWPDPSTAVPMGEPLLMWSANGDGQIRQDLIDTRDAKFGIKTADIRARRAAWGYKVPNIPPPTSADQLGRIWTASGPDEPTKKSN